MPTPAEQKALLFLGAVALLGGAVRLLGDDPPVTATGRESAGLASQLAATDSAAAARSAERKSGGGKRKKKPSSRQRRDSTATFEPRPTPDAQRATPVDIDRATLDQLTALPGIGPALAARIVADRQANGAFGSIDALDAVPGVGPALIRRLGPHVTFSGPRRPSTATTSGGGVRASGRVVGLIGGRP